MKNTLNSHSLFSTGFSNISENAKLNLQMIMTELKNYVEHHDASVFVDRIKSKCLHGRVTQSNLHLCLSDLEMMVKPPTPGANAALTP
jgi:hypothetical protein